MKALQNALTVGVLAIVGVVAYQYFSSKTLDRRVGESERRLDEVKQETATQKQSLERHDGELATHTQDLKSHTDSITELRKRVAAAEGRLTELGRASEADRQELQKLKAALGDLESRQAVLDDKRRDLQELERDLRKRLQRDQDIERRLILIEKQLGIERPQP